MEISILAIGILTLSYCPPTLASGQTHSVDLTSTYDWYCRDGGGRRWRPGRSIDNDCYKYVCTRGKGIKRFWKVEIKGHCCARNGVAYHDGDVISSVDGGCTSTREVCSIEDNVAMVVKTINNTCCSGSGAVEAKVQWYNYMHSEAGTFLDVSADGQPILAEADQNSDSQQWRLEKGKLLNKGIPGKTLGLAIRGGLGMIEASSDQVLTSLVFENGRFVDTSHSFELMIAGNGEISLSHNIAKRQVLTNGISSGRLVQLKSGGVECPELGDWPPFQPFSKNPVNTQCWEENKPLFRLYMGSTTSIIASKMDHLTSIPVLNPSKISKLVVVFHGYQSNAEIGEWPDLMAQLVMGYDHTPNIAVLTVDWKEGADVDSWRVYTKAAAQTRYVGVATERIIRQLKQDEDIYIHCIGHSLGSHVCSFLSNAIKDDQSYNKKTKLLDRITAMDPAGPNFYSISPINTDPINAGIDEKIDKSDAVLIDAIHTDTDWLGTIPTVGHADFYVGNSIPNLGKEQFDCKTFVCDHGRSHELLRHSIGHNAECWAHINCKGQDPDDNNGCAYVETDQCEVISNQSLPMTYPDGCNPDISPRIHFGYWWDGTPGHFGVVLNDRKTCYRCIDDTQCIGDDKCDVIQHKCVDKECLRDEHCGSGQSCDTIQNICTPPLSCSSETSEDCKAQSGYCGNPNSCQGTVLDNLCPGGQDNKCCTGMPFQEDECTAAGGTCEDICGCDGEGEVLHGYCPSQYNSIKCCKRSSSNTTSESCEEKRRRKRQAESCSSETSEDCKAKSGYCGNPNSCPGTVLDGLCPRGQDNKCCTGMPFQEDECTAAGGTCGDICGCDGDGEVLHGYCPSQYNSIKCCKRPSSNTTSGFEMCEIETEGNGENESGENENADCSQLVCKTGLSTSCSNGKCKVSCGGVEQCSGSCSSISTSCRNGDCKLTCNGGGGSLTSSTAAGAAGSGTGSGSGGSGTGSSSGGSGTGTNSGSGSSSGGGSSGANNNNNNNNNGGSGSTGGSGGGGNNNFNYNYNGGSGSQSGTGSGGNYNYNFNGK